MRDRPFAFLARYLDAFRDDPAIASRSEPATAENAEATAAVAYRRAQLRAIRAHSPLMLCAHLLFAAILMISFVHDAPLETSLWCAVIVAYVLAAVAPLLRRRGRKSGPKPLAHYEKTLDKAFWLNVGAALSWGLAPVLFFAAAEKSEIMVLGAMVGTVCIGAAFVFSPAPRIAAAFCACASLPTLIATAYLVAVGDPAAHLQSLLPMILLPVVCLHLTVTNFETFSLEFSTRRALEEKNQTVSLLLRDFSAQSNDWLWQIDDKLRLNYASHRMCGVLATDAAQSRRSLIDELKAKGADRAVLAELLRKMRRREPFEGLVTPLGGNLDTPCCWYALSGEPAVADNGRFYGYRGVARDVTEAQLAMNALREARDVAQRANAAKSRFLAMASHELRTPMNAILGFSDVIANDHFGLNPPDAYRAYGADIHDAGEHLLGLINDLLDASLIEEGRMRLQEETVTAESLAQEALAFCSKSIEERGAEAWTDHTLDAVAVKIDRRRIRQVLMNLITNAAKYAGDRARIALEARRTQTGVDILVRDDGPGLEPEQIRTVFEPFVQGSEGSRALGGTVKGGLGLGLPIARALAQAHGGDLRLENRIDPATGQIMGLDGVLSLPDDRVTWRAWERSA